MSNLTLQLSTQDELYKISSAIHSSIVGTDDWGAPKRIILHENKFTVLWLDIGNTSDYPYSSEAIETIEIINLIKELLTSDIVHNVKQLQLDLLSKSLQQETTV